MGKTTVFLFCYLVFASLSAEAAEAPGSNAAKAAAAVSRLESRDVAVVDLQRIFEHFVRLENLSQRLSEKRRAASGDVAKRMKRLSQLQEQERQMRGSAGPRPDVADQARLDGMAEEIRFLQEEAGTLIREKGQEIKDRERQWSSDLMVAISDQVRRLAATDRLYLVLDRGPWVLSVGAKADLTERVIRGLERERGNLRFQ